VGETRGYESTLLLNHWDCQLIYFVKLYMHYFALITSSWFRISKGGQNMQEFFEFALNYSEQIQ